jgi:hypothetical protein
MLAKASAFSSGEDLLIEYRIFQESKSLGLNSTAILAYLYAWSGNWLFSNIPTALAYLFELAGFK